MVYNLSLTFAFQALYGYVYSWIGLLVSVFMAARPGRACYWPGATALRNAHSWSWRSLGRFLSGLPWLSKRGRLIGPG